MQCGEQTTFETLSFRFNVLLAALWECLTLLVLALVPLIPKCFFCLPFFCFCLFFATHAAYAHGVVNEQATGFRKKRPNPFFFFVVGGGVGVSL